MSIIVCDNVNLSYGTTEILKNINFSVNEGERLGIIGINGAGKSTLAHIISGDISPTSGNVFISNSVSVGLLAQRAEDDFKNKTIYEAALASFRSLADMESELDRLISKISENPALVSEYERKRHDFEIKGGNEYKTKIKSMLVRFGFPAEMWDTPASSLSGGQKTRLALCALLMSGKDVMILDEPTNHLDADTIEWLEDFIASSSKTFIIISHDRYFLDKVTTHTLEIEHLTALKYSGNYSSFKEKKQKERETQEKHYEIQQKEIKRLEAFIENQIRWGQEQNYIAAKSRQKAIDRIERIEKPKSDPKTIRINLKSSSISSHSVLSVRNLSKSYGENDLFKNLSFEIVHGERVMITGANGCGKSTLLKIINGIVEADSGVCELGYSQIIGYYDQEVQVLSEKNTVLGEMLEADSSLIPVQARTILGSYGFTGDDAFKEVSVLSGGERARLSIAKLVLKKVSFLILDEPTNHLDIPSKEQFEDALMSFDGTILAVTHDRYFANKLANRIIEIDKNGYDRGYFDFKGGYDEFIKKRVKKNVIQSETKDTSSRNEYETLKKEKSIKKTKQKRYEFLSSEIPRLESQISELEKECEINASDYIKLGELDAQIAAIKASLEPLYDEYFTLEEENT